MAAWYCRDVSTSWQSSCDNALDAVFERFGFVPAPTFDTDYANALTSTDRDRYSRFHAYHTTIVYALLLLARHGRQPVPAVDPAQDLGDLTPILAAAFDPRVGFSFAGTGVDPEWFHPKASDLLRFRNDLIAELILTNVSDRVGCETAAALASDIVSGKLDSPLADTIAVLIAHRREYGGFVTPEPAVRFEAH